MTRWLIIFIGIGILSSSLFAFIGKIEALKGNVVVQRDGKTLQAQVGFKLEEKDTVLSKGKSKAQIIFKDKTVITIGKDSKFIISEYLFEENQTFYPLVEF